MGLKGTSPVINGKGRRKLSSWIESFSDHVGKFAGSPEVFRIWGGISVIAATLERKVWIDTGKPLYPNLYTILVGPSGTGKTRVIDEASAVIREADSTFLSPSSLTKASLVDALNENHRKYVAGIGEVYEYNSMFVAVDEFSVLMHERNTEMVAALTKFYDNNFYEETRRTSKLHIAVDQPNLNLLCGSTPTNLMYIMPQAAWTQGLTGRTVMVYSKEITDRDMFENEKVELPPSLVADLKLIAEVSGRLAISTSYKDCYRDWAKTYRTSGPQHPLLEDYNARRSALMLKLGMIAAVDRKSMQLEQGDFATSLDWLLDAELNMTNIFLEGQVSEDARSQDQVLEYIRANDPCPERRVIAFMSRLIPAQKIIPILQLMRAAGVVEFDGNDGTWSITPTLPPPVHQAEEG